MSGPSHQSDLFNTSPLPRTISALKPQLRDPEMIAVMSGRVRLAQLPREEVKKFGLFVGRVITDELVERMRQCDDVVRGRLQAQRILEYRACSRAVLLERLNRKGIQPAAAEQVADWAESIGLIDDERLGREILAQIARDKPAGPRLQEHALIRAKIPPPVRRRLLSQNDASPEGRSVRDESGPDETQRILDYLCAQLARMPTVKPKTQARRLASLLDRRGYDEETAGELLRRVLPDET